MLTLAVIAIAVTPTPRASAVNFNYWKHCNGSLLVYGTKGTELTLGDESKWDTDDWTTKAKKQLITRSPLHQYSQWSSASGFARGCHATVEYRWPGGSAKFSMTLTYEGHESVSCNFVGDARSCDETSKEIDEPDYQTKVLLVGWLLVLP